MSEPVRQYVVTAKYDGGGWREWEQADSYDDGRMVVVGLRQQYPAAKFRLVERTITDVITEA